MSESSTSLRALLIEDNPGDARLIREMLRESTSGRTPPVHLQHADRLSAGLEQLKADAATHVVLLDLSLPDSSGFDTFKAVRRAAPEVALVVLSGLDDQDLAVKAVQEGAQDYLVKGQVEGGTLLRAMRYAVERQRLERLRRELERQRDEFFSSVSHDLRTPVAAIKAAIGVVLANEPSGTPPAVHRLLGNIDLAADELARLIEDLLEVARLQAGRVELWRSSVDLREVVTRAVRAVEPLIESNHQRLQISVPDQPVVASVDVERIGRVLRNLLGNANTYGREGGSIGVSLEQTSAEACLAVSDDGPGIPADQQERIFERFYRVGGAASTGTGLGLAIARGLVDLHGGRLWVESTPGQGSTFRVTLPRH